MEQTPWRMVQEFFKKYDDKTGNYTEVELKSDQKTIKLYKNSDGSITVYDPFLESDICYGRCSVEARILITGKIRDERDVLHLQLTSASNVILSKGKHSGHSYYSISLEHYRKDGHKIRLLVAEPGAQSMCLYVHDVIYEGGSDVIVEDMEQTIKQNIVQINVDKPWDLMIGYLRSSIKGNDIYLDEVNKIIFYLKNDSNRYLERNSIERLVMVRDDDGNISITYVSNNLNEMFEEKNFKGVKVMKENLLVGEEGEREELQIYEEEKDDDINVIYIDQYPRGERGHTMRLGFAVRFEDCDRITRVSSYKIIGMEVC